MPGAFRPPSARPRRLWCSGPPLMSAFPDHSRPRTARFKRALRGACCARGQRWAPGTRPTRRSRPQVGGSATPGGTSGTWPWHRATHPPSPEAAALTAGCGGRPGAHLARVAPARAAAPGGPCAAAGGCAPARRPAPGAPCSGRGRGGCPGRAPAAAAGRGEPGARLPAGRPPPGGAQPVTSRVSAQESPPPHRPGLAYSQQKGRWQEVPA